MQVVVAVVDMVLVVLVVLVVPALAVLVAMQLPLQDHLQEQLIVAAGAAVGLAVLQVAQAVQVL